MLKNSIIRIFIIASALLLTSCMTFQEQKQMKDDMFKMQTRLLELEKNMKNDNAGITKRTDKASQEVANVSSSMGSLEREIQKLAGDVDLVKYAFKTGEAPAPLAGENSLFSRFSSLEDRVTVVEQTQKDILTMLEKIQSSNNKSKKPGSNLKTSKKISTLSEAREAFKRKRYSYLKRDIPGLKKKMTKQSSQYELDYLYAESLFKLGNLKDAAIEFHDFLDSKPPVKYLPHAKMRMGDCYRHLGDKETASIYYEELITEFPKAPESKTARERLAKIKK